MQQDPSTALQSYLKEGEKLIWSGRPARYFVLNGDEKGQIVFGAVWLAVTLGWMYTVSQSVNYFYALLGIPFGGYGVNLVFCKPYYKTMKRKNMVYGVTNQRMMFLNTEEKELRAIELSQLQNILLKAHPNGLGDVILCLRYHSFSFDQLADSLPVYQMITDLKRKFINETTQPADAAPKTKEEEDQPNDKESGGYRNV